MQYWYPQGTVPVYTDNDNDNFIWLQKCFANICTAARYRSRCSGGPTRPRGAPGVLDLVVACTCVRAASNLRRCEPRDLLVLSEAQNPSPRRRLWSESSHVSATYSRDLVLLDLVRYM